MHCPVSRLKIQKQIVFFDVFHKLRADDSLKQLGNNRQVRYGFLLVCYSKSERRTVFEIFDFRSAVTLTTGLDVRRGHCTGKCHHSIEGV